MAGDGRGHRGRARALPAGRARARGAGGPRAAGRGPDGAAACGSSASDGSGLSSGRGGRRGGARRRALSLAAAWRERAPASASEGLCTRRRVERLCSGDADEAPRSRGGAPSPAAPTRDAREGSLPGAGRAWTAAAPRGCRRRSAEGSLPCAPGRAPSRPRRTPASTLSGYGALFLPGPFPPGPGFPLLPPRPRGLGASGLPTFRLHTDPSGPSHSLPSASPRVLDGLSTFFSTFTFSNALWQADDWRMRTHEVCTHAIGSLGRLKLRMSVSSGGRGLQLLARGCVRPPVRRRRSHRVIAASTGKTARMSGANMPPGPLGPVREGVMTVTGAGTWSAGSTIAPQQRRTRGAAAPFGER